MLGRLLNSRSTESADSHGQNSHVKNQYSKSSLTRKFNQNIPQLPNDLQSQQVTPQSQQSQPLHQQQLLNYTNEDSYSRTLLYGTPNTLDFIPLEKHHFRMLIIKDKGALLQQDNYKILVDTANNSRFDRPKINNRHQTHELLDFIFGNPIYQDLNRDDYFKIHILSSLPNLKNSILITKHFFIDKKERYAIGVVIPIGLSDFSSGILSNWSTVIKYLNLIKNIFIGNHIMRKSSTCSTGPNGQFSDVVTIFCQFIKSMKQLTSVPRLLVGLIKFDSILYNWCYEVNNWIEIKDGARLGFSGTKFLTTLLTIVLGIRTQLVSSDSTSDEGAKLVIMAANPIVAQKLIFIVSGLLPCRINLQIKQEREPSTNSQTTMEPLKVPSEGLRNLQMNDTVSSQQLTPPTPSMINNGWEIPNTPSKSIATPSIMTPSRSSVIQPTTMSNSSSMAYLSSSLSYSQSSTFSTSLSRGFQLLQNWKNTSSALSDSSSISSSQSHKTPSPSMEYDEYPWYSNNNPNSFPVLATPGAPHTHMHHQHHLSRTSSCYDLTSNLKSLKRQTLPKLPNIERSTSTLYRVGSSSHHKDGSADQTRKDCSNLMNSKRLTQSTEKDSLKKVTILEVSFDDNDHDSSSNDINNLTNYGNTPLPQLCGYVNEFIPEFHVQACPLSQDLESKIISTMKSDLSVHSSTRTILVSLRAREITEFTLIKNTTGDGEYRSNVKKLYSNARCSASIDKEEFNKVDRLLEAVVGKFHDNEGATGGNSNNNHDDSNNTTTNLDEFKVIEQMLTQL